MIEAIGIIVPAHDEEALLPTCLASLEGAALHSLLPTKIVIVLDACTDGSADIVGEYGVAVAHRCVGRARAAGVAEVLRHFAEIPRERLWLAMTDADSCVPTDWLSKQLEAAAKGVVGIAGTVSVDDWGDYPRTKVETYEDFYAREDHVHGANMGVRADAYLAVGGFSPVATSEDVALWQALQERGCTLASTRDNPVITSSRLTARAPDGFASFLRGWAA